MINKKFLREDVMWVNEQLKNEGATFLNNDECKIILKLTDILCDFYTDSELIKLQNFEEVVNEEFINQLLTKAFAIMIIQKGGK